jgi:hypothetical protein
LFELSYPNIVHLINPLKELLRCTPKINRKKEIPFLHLPALIFRNALPRQPREGGMAVPAVYAGGVETSPTRNPQDPM